jgi:hypothetical protein
MPKPILDELAALSLGGVAIIRGVRVVRATLLGFQIGSEIVDAREAARRLATAAKSGAWRIEICFRCMGDGLGRRDRGLCRVCGGCGVHVVEPPAGWAEAAPAILAAALDRALVAWRSTRHARARQSLGALLAIFAPLAPASAGARAFGELRRGAVEDAAPAEAQRALG